MLIAEVFGATRVTRASFKGAQSTIRDVADRFWSDNVTFIASAVAFRTALAIFPAIGVLSWLSTLFISAEDLILAIETISSSLPQSSRDVVVQAVKVSAAAGTPGGGANSLFAVTSSALGIALALWSASSGIAALLVALNTIFQRTETRGALQLLSVTVALTIGGLLIGLLGITLIIIGPDLLSAANAPANWATVWGYIRWPLNFILVVLGLAILYTFGPNHGRQRKFAISIGSVAGALALTVCSSMFSWFMTNFAALPVTYGSLSTFVAFMIWLWLSFSIVLTGAELDAAVNRSRTRTS